VILRTNDWPGVPTREAAAISALPPAERAAAWARRGYRCKTAECRYGRERELKTSGGGPART
jgi:hypothetical protein